MKKIVVLMLSAAIVCMPCAAFAQASQTSELERFLAEHNLTIPQVFADESGAEDFYYWVMDILREDPYHIFAFGHYDYQIFSEQIQQAYIAENHISSVLNTNANVDQRNLLKYNSFYADGSPDYNCYSYAIDYTSRWLIIGTLSGQNWNPKTATIESSANMVRDDLEFLGNECISVGYVLPQANDVYNGYNVIALRLSPVGKSSTDFHFMKLDYSDGDVWRHKPGHGCILTYNYLPTNDRIWYSEGIVESSDGYYYGSSSLYYDSKIAYFIYAPTHLYAVRSTGNNYHGRGADQFKHFYEYIKTCNSCGYSYTYWRAELCKGPCPIQRVVEYV